MTSICSEHEGHRSYPERGRGSAILKIKEAVSDAATIFGIILTCTTVELLIKKKIDLFNSLRECLLFSLHMTRLKTYLRNIFHNRN
jgi:hypothetical protein